ncbi:hypothetical protein D3C75_795160 [compost metagenome]
MFEIGIHHDGGEDDHEGDIAHVEAIGPSKQILDLRSDTNEAEIEQQTATHPVTGQPRQQTAALGNAQHEAQHADHDAQRHRMAAGGDDQRNQRNQRTMGAGQVGGRVEHAGKQHHEQQRGNQHLEAGVFDHELAGQPQRTGKGRHHRSDHDDLADGRRHRRNPVFQFEAIVAQRQVHRPAPRRHDGQFVFEVFFT